MASKPSFKEINMYISIQLLSALCIALPVVAGVLFAAKFKYAGLFFSWATLVCVSSWLYLTAIEHFVKKDEEEKIEASLGVKATGSLSLYNHPLNTYWLANMNSRLRIYGACLINLTNATKLPLRVSRFIVSEQVTEKYTPIIDTSNLWVGEMYCGMEMDKMMGIDYLTLDAALQNRSIPAGETIRGWVFLIRTPKHNLEIEITDDAGKSYTAKILPPPPQVGFIQSNLSEMNLNRRADLRNLREEDLSSGYLK